MVGKTKKNKDSVKVGEVRVQVRFQPNKKAEDKFKGHVFEVSPHFACSHVRFCVEI